jgi:dienelactone hydrolase
MPFDTSTESHAPRKDLTMNALQPRHWSWLIVLALLPSGLLSAQEPRLEYPPAGEVRDAFVKLLKRPKVLFNVKIEETKKDDDDESILIERLTFVSEKKADETEERVPVLIYRPAKGTKKLPAVIVLHGTGGDKESQRPYLLHLVKRGIIGIAIDARYHGERSGGAKGAEAYNEAIVKAWKAKDGDPQEHPFYYDTVWDLWRLVDYLETRDDVDPQRLGMIGFSMGGIQTWLAASVDTRIKVIVPAISVQSFRWSLENDRWQGRANTIKAAHEAAAKDLGEDKVNAKVCKSLWNKVIPGMLDQFDCPSMIRLCVGRPLLIISGEDDPNCPIGGAKLAISAAEEIYKAKAVEDLLKVDVAKGVGHKVTPEQRQMALDWLEKWLK